MAGRNLLDWKETGLMLFHPIIHVVGMRYHSMSGVICRPADFHTKDDKFLDRDFFSERVFHPAEAHGKPDGAYF